MPRYCCYRYYLGSTVYEVEADDPEQAYAKLEFAVHGGKSGPDEVRMKHEAMLPALNEITTHVFGLQPTSSKDFPFEMDDDPCLVIHKERDEKLTELVRTGYDDTPELQQP